MPHSSAISTELRVQFLCQCENQDTPFAPELLLVHAMLFRMALSAQGNGPLIVWFFTKADVALAVEFAAEPDVCRIAWTSATYDAWTLAQPREVSGVVKSRLALVHASIRE